MSSSETASPEIVPAQNRLLYRVREGAQRLAVSTSQMYSLINAGEVKAIRLGGSLRIPVAELDRIANGPGVTA